MRSPQIGEPVSRWQVRRQLYYSTSLSEEAKYTVYTIHIIALSALQSICYQIKFPYLALLQLGRFADQCMYKKVVEEGEV